MKLLVALASVCGFLLCLSSSHSVAESSAIYCGKLLWPAHRADYLPFPEGMAVTHSTEPTVAQVIKKSGKHSVRFAYEDMSISYKLIRDAIDAIIIEGENRVCLQAGTVRRSRWQTPIEVSPLTSDNGRVVFEFSPARAE